MTETNNLAIMEALQKAQANKSKVADVVPGQKYLPKLVPGKYIAVVTKVQYEKNQPSKFGINNRVKVTFDVITNDESQELVVSYWESPSDTSLYVLHLSSLLGRDSRDGFTLNELNGVIAQIEVVHNKTEKGIFVNIQCIQVIDPKQLGNQVNL
ncbi:hypothetical protein F2Y18_15765 [Bacillus cereus]|uniref:hypothetical protein n=1 Tax=Bacillus cereus TaxID=1396 RepID=UPI00122EB0FA|nr:hypothetical protein [Bacillus cereus]KAA2396101.1 hypothetical protein F2Y18_15765 [Bacillus cereus]